MSDDISLNLPAINNLDQRERRLVLALLSGLKEADACRVAGYAESTIRARVGKIVSADRIQSVITAAMAQAGISPELLAEKIREGLDADKPVVVDKIINSCADYHARHKYLETALRLGGHEPAKQVDEVETYEDRVFRLRGIKQ